MKLFYLALFIFIAPVTAMEKISPAVLSTVQQAMSRTVNDFDLKSSTVVKKPMVELAEVDWRQKRYLICLRSGHIENVFEIGYRPSTM